MPSRRCEWRSLITPRGPDEPRFYAKSRLSSLAPRYSPHVKMNPQELEDSLVDYLYDELDEGARARFEAALPDSPEIAAEVAAHRRTREAMEALEDVPVPEGLLDGLLVEAERRADARIEIEPSFLEKLVAGLLQPAFLTLGLFFIVATTGYFMVEREGGPQTADTSVAEKTTPPAAASKLGEVESAEVPELLEKRNEREEVEESETDDEASDEATGSKSNERGELNERLSSPLENQEPAMRVGAQAAQKGERVATGTVARLVDLDSDPDKERLAPLAELSGSRGKRTKAAGTVGRISKSTRAAQYMGKEKDDSAGSKMDLLAVSEPNRDSRKSVKSVLRQETSVQSARRGVEEVARERESINMRSAKLAPAVRSQAYGGAASPRKKGFVGDTKARAPARSKKESAASAPAPAPAPAVPQAERQAERQADTQAEAEPPARAQAEQEARSPWQRVEHEVANQKSARSKASVWLKAYEGFMKRGRHDLAGRALDRLGKIPGYENVAKEKRRGLSKSKAAAQSKKKLKKVPTKSKSRK